MKTQLLLKKILLVTGLFFLLTGINSCSDDDESPPPIQQIFVDDNQNLEDNTLNIRQVIVNQDSFLTAIKVDDENSDDFIASPIFLTEGTHRNIELSFYENTVKNGGSGQKIILKLYADNKNGGTRGIWDPTDEPIMNLIEGLLKKTITVYTEYDPFSYYDNNNDEFLDFSEASLTYPNNFTSIWDTDNNSSLDLDEFYYTTFINTDVNIDLTIDQEEWEEGFNSMFNNWAEDKFTEYDESKNNFLSQEEWNNIFMDSLWFEAYDTDDNDLVTQEELNLGLLSDWDLNNDLQIDEEEFNNYYDHVTNWVEYYDW